MTGVLPNEVPAILERGDQMLPQNLAQIERLRAGCRSHLRISSLTGVKGQKALQPDRSSCVRVPRVSAQITEPSAFATARWIEGAGLDALAASSVVCAVPRGASPNGRFLQLTCAASF